MRQLLIINPNTSSSVTALLLQHARSLSGQDVQVRAVTARFGAPYISCEASYAVAGHATLDAWASDLASNAPDADAVLIGCFGDPGLLALRETSAAAVTGLAEAAFEEARAMGRFAVVTGGERWKPMLRRLADMLGFADSLLGVHTVMPSGAQLAQDRPRARTLLQRACLDTWERTGADALVLGGAGLAGLAAEIQAGIPVPVIDSVSAGVRQALLRVDNARARGNNRVDFAWNHVSAELKLTGHVSKSDEF